MIDLLDDVITQYKETNFDERFEPFVEWVNIIHPYFDFIEQDSFTIHPMFQDVIYKHFGYYEVDDYLDVLRHRAQDEEIPDFDFNTADPSFY